MVGDSQGLLTWSDCRWAIGARRVNQIESTMWSYFRGWKRKIGVVTLAMACGFMMAWMRSFHYWDAFTFVSGNSLDRLLFGHEGITWERTLEPGSVLLRVSHRRYRCIYDAKGLRPLLEGWNYRHLWRWQFCGFDFGELMVEGQAGKHRLLFSVPYWSIVAPLTLISAWCLLTKPRLKPATKPETADA
jgi:hypothetical protein